MASGNKRKKLQNNKEEVQEHLPAEPEQKRIRSATRRAATGGVSSVNNNNTSGKRTTTRSRIEASQPPIRRIVDEIIEEEEAEEVTRIGQPAAGIMPGETERNGGGLTVEAMKLLLNDQLKNLTTREDVDSIGERITANAEEITKLRGEMQRIKRDSERNRISNNTQILKEVTKIVEETLESRETIIPRGANGRQSNREEIFLTSRRSVRIWPIEGDTSQAMRSNLDTFLLEALQLTREEIDDLDIESVTRTRLRHNARIHLEVLVKFSSVEARDQVAMRGGYLAEFVDSCKKPLAGIRMDIPMYLNGVFKLLNSYGYKLRQLHGEGTKRYVKYDEANLSLYLDVRTPESEEWFQITPAQAKELQELRDQSNMKRLYKSLRVDSGSSSGASSGASTSSMEYQNSQHAFPIRLLSQS